MFEELFKLSIGKFTKKGTPFYYLWPLILNFSTSMEELNDGGNIYLFYFLTKYRCLTTWVLISAQNVGVL